MLEALLIIVDEDFVTPIYAEPDPEEMEPDHWRRAREIIVEVYEAELRTEGFEELGDAYIGWKVVARNGLSFIAVARDVESADLMTYLKDLVKTYFDEVDDVRRPELDGVEDIVVEVIPPWEE